MPTYNEASLLGAVDVKIRGSSTATPFVRNVDYNARGQRISIAYAGTSSAAFTTGYAYDAMTFRLSNQTTTRASDNVVLQDFSPYYDPVGNIVEVGDAADQTLYFSGSTPVTAGTQYTYDAIYRLLTASGREHPGQQQPETMTNLESPLASVPQGRCRHPFAGSCRRFARLQGRSEGSSHISVGGRGRIPSSGSNLQRGGRPG